MDLLNQILIFLNMLANAVGSIVLAPVAFLPGWLSATLIAIGTGILMLVCFKYTSNQRAIKRTRDSINANLYAMRLFKDNLSVTLKGQAGLLWGAFRLLLFAIIPLLVMIVPMTLLLGQISLWYQARPLHVGEETVVTLTLKEFPESSWPEVKLQPSEAFEVELGPVRVQSKREICWNIIARKEGYHRVVFEVDGQPIEKNLTIGNDLMKVSSYRPGSSWADIVMYPQERPFPPYSAVQLIEIVYPDRDSWIYGTDNWVIYWFIVAFIAALLLRGKLKVNI
jgi:hypothetical protein